MDSDLKIYLQGNVPNSWIWLYIIGVFSNNKKKKTKERKKKSTDIVTHNERPSST